MASSSDFVGSTVGESQKKTNAMLEKARGKVLVIDEVYNLDDMLYGKQVRSRICCAVLLIYTFFQELLLFSYSQYPPCYGLKCIQMISTIKNCGKVLES